MDCKEQTILKSAAIKHKAMKKLILLVIVTALLSMVGANAYAHDIEVANADGVTIYYNWINDKTELAVTYR